MKTKLKLPIEPKEIMKTTFRLTVAAFGLASFNVSAATLYVSLESPNPSPPFATWATAATNIQHAVDAARAGDTALVTNGVYAEGGKTNEWGWVESRVTITNAIRLESVNGPLVTTITGGGRCVYLGSNAVLSGFTLTNGRAGRIEWGMLGGGVCSEPSGIVTNCVITGNSAYGNIFYNARGGGAYGGTLYNCTLTNNEVTPGWGSFGGPDHPGQGGGACNSILYNCVLIGNRGRGPNDWDSGAGGAGL